MSQQTDREEMHIRYLLGGLSEDERTHLEEQFFTDNAEFEQLEIAEGELVDRYVQNELSATDFRQFQKTLEKSRRLRERVEIAKILATRVASTVPQRGEDESPEPVIVKPKKTKDQKPPWWNLIGSSTQIAPALRLAVAGQLALLLLISVALIVVWIRSRAESQRLIAQQQQLHQLEQQVANQRAKNEGLQAALTQTQQQNQAQEKSIAEYQQTVEELKQQASSPILSFVLTPGSGQRGGENTEREIQHLAGARELSLLLNVEGGDYRSYNAALRSISRKPILQRAGLKPVQRGSSKYIPFRVAAKLLPPGRYIVHVDGLTPAGEPEDFNDYAFRVTTR